jgi:hypothetical protein
MDDRPAPDPPLLPWTNRTGDQRWAEAMPATDAPTAAPTAGRAWGVSVRFNSPQEFLAELRRRPPDIEPVVRLTYRWSPDPAGLPLRHVSVVAGYLRRIRGTLVLQELVHYAGEVWPTPGEGASRRTQERADLAHRTVEEAARELGLEVAAGQYALGSLR